MKTWAFEDYFYNKIKEVIYFWGRGNLKVEKNLWFQGRHHWIENVKVSTKRQFFLIIIKKQYVIYLGRIPLSQRPCGSCWSNLDAWLRGARKAMSFVVPSQKIIMMTAIFAWLIHRSTEKLREEYPFHPLLYLCHMMIPYWFHGLRKM